MTRPPMLMPVATAGMPAYRDISGTWQQFMGIPTDAAAQAYNSLADYGKAPADEAWVYRCVALKAFFAQATPLRVYVKDGRERIPADDSGDGTAQELQGLLDDVNPLSMNGGDLKAFSTAAMAVWGENYVRKVRGRFGGRPQELWWLRAPDITPKMGRSWIDTYAYRPSGSNAVGEESFAFRDVLAWRNVNLQDPTRGLSPLAAARNAILVSRLHEEQSVNLIANWSVPPGAWVIPKDADFSSQDRSLVQRALRALRGPRNRGKVPVLPQGLTWQAIALTPQDQETLGARKVSRMQICAAEGVPLVLAGDDEKTTVYANMRDAERIFARYMINELDAIAEGYNGWLVPEFDTSRPRRIVVGFDYSEIEALQAPLEERKRVALAEIQHGARTGDEYRAEFKTGQALPNGEGQIVTRLSTLIPIGEGPAAPPADTTASPAALPPDGSADTLRSFGRDLYKHPTVKAWISNPSAPLDTTPLLGYPTSAAARMAIEAGLRRRATAAAIADELEGVPV